VSQPHGTNQQAKAELVCRLLGHEYVDWMLCARCSASYLEILMDKKMRLLKHDAKTQK